MSLLPDEGNSPQPTGGTESPTSSPSGNESQLLAEVKAMATRLDEQEKLVKSFQKGNDKQIGQVRSEVKRILELKEQGLNESQIQRELWIDSQMEERNSSSVPLTGKQADTRPSIDIEGSLKDLQFEENDVALAALKLAYQEPTELLRQAAKLRVQQLTKPNLSSANSLPPEGGSVPSKANLQELTSKYQNDMLAARGNKTLLRQIKDKAIKDGVPVDSIAFV